MTDYLIALGGIAYVVIFLSIAMVIITLNVDDYISMPVAITIVIAQFYFMLIVPLIFLAHHHVGLHQWLHNTN